MQTQPSPPAPTLIEAVAQYPLLDALRGRRSRRFGLGMKIEHGPLAYESQYAPLPLSEAEEAVLAFAACGINGPALADVSYGSGEGGTMLAGLVGRTAASPDAIPSVAVVVINDNATYLLKRPQDFAATDLPALLDLAERGELTELYRRSRVKIADGRTVAPVEPGLNLNINKWSLYARGGTYFLPINDITAFYLNVLLEIFDETMAYFVLDDRANFRPAGIGRFARSKGGHLNDDIRGNRVYTLQSADSTLAQMVAVEQGMIVQNLGLMGQALGLGGMPNFAGHEYAWLQALGFRMGQLPASRYAGASRLVSLVFRLMRQDAPIPYGLGLERDGVVLLKPYCPPYYPSMEAAVRAFIDTKFGPQGVFRGGAAAGGWQEPATAATIAGPSEAAIQATIAFCEYVYGRYGRFPAYATPYRTLLGYQAVHVDVDFYDHFYRPEALTDAQRQHMARWHSGEQSRSPLANA